MADNNRTFTKRVISGLLGAAIIFSLSYFGGLMGMNIVCISATVLAVREFSRMAFLQQDLPDGIGYLYTPICAALYVLLILHYESSLLSFALANVLFLFTSL